MKFFFSVLVLAQTTISIYLMKNIFCIISLTAILYGKCNFEISRTHGISSLLNENAICDSFILSCWINSRRLVVLGRLSSFNHMQRPRYKVINFIIHPTYVEVTLSLKFSRVSTAQVFLLQVQLSKSYFSF